MTQKYIKFGSSETVKFIEIYRNHECLWDTENENYKNRDARNTALRLFAEEFGVEDFGPKEITAKIKNLRTQYQSEKKKVKDSMGTGSSTGDIYIPKLAWYELMDSFLRKTHETRKTTSNLADYIEVIPQESIPIGIDSEDVMGVAFMNVENIPPQQSTSNNVLSGHRRNKRNNFETALKKLDQIEKRARIEEDELDAFGKYVASSLRTLNVHSCVEAQDEIQTILSKYKLLNIAAQPNEATPMPETPQDEFW